MTESVNESVVTEEVTGANDDASLWEEAVNSVYKGGSAVSGIPGVPLPKLGEEKKEAASDKTAGTDVGGNGTGSKNSGDSEKKTDKTEESAEDEDVSGDNEEWLRKLNGDFSGDDVTVHKDGKTEKLPEKKAEEEKEKKKVEDEKDEKVSDADVPVELSALMKKIAEELKNDTELKQNFEEYPDDMQTFSKIAGKMIEKVLPHLEGQIYKKFEEELKGLREFRNASEAETERQRQISWEAKIAESVPDWHDIIHKDKSFPAWFEKQPTPIKDCLQKASTAEDVIFALQKFKSDKEVLRQGSNKAKSLYSNPVNESDRRKVAEPDDRRKGLFRNAGDEDNEEWKDAVEWATKNR